MTATTFGISQNGILATGLKKALPVIRRHQSDFSVKAEAQLGRSPTISLQMATAGPARSPAKRWSKKLCEGSSVPVRYERRSRASRVGPQICAVLQKCTFGKVEEFVRRVPCSAAEVEKGRKICARRASASHYVKQQQVKCRLLVGPQSAPDALCTNLSTFSEWLIARQSIARELNRGSTNPSTIGARNTVPGRKSL